MEGGKKEGGRASNFLFLLLLVSWEVPWLAARMGKVGGRATSICRRRREEQWLAAMVRMSFPLLPTFSSSPHPFYLAQLRVSLSPSFLWKRGRKKDKGMEGGMHFLENSSSLPLCFVERGWGISANVSPSPAFVPPTRAEERPCPLSSSFRGEGLLPIVASPPTAALTLWAGGGREGHDNGHVTGREGCSPLPLPLSSLLGFVRNLTTCLPQRGIGGAEGGEKRLRGFGCFPQY